MAFKEILNFGAPFSSISLTTSVCDKNSNAGRKQLYGHTLSQERYKKRRTAVMILVTIVIVNYQNLYGMASKMNLILLNVKT